MSHGRRAMLEVQWAQPAPPVRRVVLEPGRVLRVGRTELADFRVPADGQMSGVHFELAWDGERGVVRDRGSDKGTWVDGRLVREGEVKSGGWLRAGDTLFMVYFEGVRERQGPADAPAVVERKERALAALRGEETPLFALLDAARDKRVLEVLRGSVEEHQSLYDGVKGEALAEVAPYLVSLPREGGLLERLVREGWGESWGVFLTSTGAFAAVRRHFRRILMVEAEEAGHPARRVYFRFYDPRVLRDFLPMCNARQAPELFGQCDCFLLEGERAEVLRFGASEVTR
ncbi:DUF4123 domain-containing protein [Sorangium sp. So ce131]|uniref:DUF4123 domain-containing protein n=1 Tax=Sorangium sp. So ce131 TaxID=3133282 RepID=UPI003F62C7AB